jgi:hypothetical protein
VIGTVNAALRPWVRDPLPRRCDSDADAPTLAVLIAPHRHSLLILYVSTMSPIHEPQFRRPTISSQRCITTTLTPIPKIRTRMECDRGARHHHRLS